MVFALRTAVISIFVAVLAFAGGAVALQQGGPGTTWAAIGSILLIAAVPLGLVVFLVLVVRHLLTRGRRRAQRRGGGARASGGGARGGGRAPAAPARGA